MKITAMMIVRNEAERYLVQVLRQLVDLADDIAIIDDGSDDRTVEVIRQFPKTRVKQFNTSRFGVEYQLRTDAWNWAMESNPDWILAIDADELFEDKFTRKDLERLCNTSDVDLRGFHLYDMWSDDYYRDDKYWSAHYYASFFLARVAALPSATWAEKNHHCGRLPQEINQLRSADSGFRIKHMGWARAEDRLLKYNRYKELDPGAKYGWAEQYESILDSKPKLVRWQ